MGVLKGVPPDQQPPRTPVPTQYEIGTATDALGVSMVVMEFRTNSGELTVFMDPDGADGFATAIKNHAEEARHKLIVAQPEHLRAIENGNRQQRRHPELS